MNNLSRLQKVNPTYWGLCKDCARSPMAAEVLARDVLKLLDELQYKTNQLTQLRAQLDEAMTSTRSTSGDINPLNWEAV